MSSKKNSQEKMTGLTKSQRIERAKRRQEINKNVQRELMLGSIFGGLSQLSTRDVRVIPPRQKVVSVEVENAQTGEAKGIWIDGKHNETEIELLKATITKAVTLATNGGLPWTYKDEKLYFEATVQEKEMHVEYGWYFPPSEYWVKENKTTEECKNCFPSGVGAKPEREVWCEKSKYNYQQCPYGTFTPTGRRPF